MKYKDYYEILGVDKEASQADIKKSFRKLAKQYHPDTNAGNKKSEEKFKEINEAFEVLGDEEKRKKYDMFGNSGHFHQGMDFDPSQYSSQFDFGNYGGGTYTYTTDSKDFSDFFNMFFGSNGSFDNIFEGAKTRNYHRGYTHEELKGQDVESEIKIDITEAYKGIKKQITLNTGMGTSSISVNIPSGILPSKKIKLKGQGLPGPSGKKGDLYLKVHFNENKKYILNGLDLTTFAEIFPWEAYFGTEKIIETMDGKIKIKIPSKIQSGQKIKITDKGYKDMKGNKGHLYVEIKIVNPSSLPPEGEEAYKKLQQLF